MGLKLCPSNPDTLLEKLEKGGRYKWSENTGRLPCYVFCICLLTTNKYIRNTNQLREAPLKKI